MIRLTTNLAIVIVLSLAFAASFLYIFLVFGRYFYPSGRSTRSINLPLKIRKQPTKKKGIGG